MQQQHQRRASADNLVSDASGNVYSVTGDGMGAMEHGSGGEMKQRSLSTPATPKQLSVPPDAPLMMMPGIYFNMSFTLFHCPVYTFSTSLELVIMIKPCP